MAGLKDDSVMLLIVAATPLETCLLRRHLTVLETFRCGSSELLQGTLLGHKILLGQSGIGAMLMAMQLTRILNQHQPQGVILCGCGGSYPDTGLAVGDLALASAEVYGDCGVATDAGFVALETLNIPQDPSCVPVFQQGYNLQSPLLVRAADILPDAARGVFVTVNCCSGTRELSIRLQQQTGGICENMEGAAAAQVCAEFSCPLLELRGISNPTGTRDPQQWNIPLGAEVAQQGVLTLLKQGLFDSQGDV